MIGLYLLCFAAHANAVPVTVALPQTGNTNELLPLSGSIKSARVARLSARTDGLVAKVLVDAGSQVRAGQPLLALDDTLAVHQLAQRQADVMAAKTMLLEKKRLHTKRRGSPATN